MKKHHNHFRWLVGIGISIGLFGLTLWIGGTLGVQPVNAQVQPTKTPTPSDVIAKYGGPVVVRVDYNECFGEKCTFYSGYCNGSGYIEFSLLEDMTYEVVYTGVFFSSGTGDFRQECRVEQLNNTIMYWGGDRSYTINPNRFSWTEICGDSPGEAINSLGGQAVNSFIGTFTEEALTGELTTCLGPGMSGYYLFDIPLIEGWESATETPEVTGTSCTPSVRGISPQKPGDVISPGASYTGPDGQGVGIIQERWFLNGVNTTSIVWDGKVVNVELQYTCLDNMGYSRTYTIPAYQAIPAPDTSQPSPPSGNPGAVGIAIGIGSIIIGIAGVTGVAGIAISQVIKGLPGSSPVQPPPTPTPPIEGAPPVQPPPTPTPPSESAPPVQPPPAPTPPIQPSPPVQPPETPEPGEQPQPPKRNLTPEEKSDLITRRGQMQEEVDRLRDNIKIRRDAVDKLSRLKKNNLIKFIFKKAIDVANWIMNSPVEVINKVTIDPAMDKLFGKHDTSLDGETIVEINNRIQKINAEIKDLREQVGYLLNEIKGTNQTLAGGGG
jgi:hypothetical protein